MEAIGPVLIVTAIPLILRLVPPNRVYGFRLGASLRDRAIWYDINQQAAWHSLALGVLMVALELVLPLSVRNGLLTGVAVAGLFTICVVNWRDASRMERERTGAPPAR